MDIGIYLLTGIFISGMLAFHDKAIMRLTVVAYWLLITLWTIGLINPFTFSSTMWLSELNIQVSYHIDGLSRLFSLLISGIGVIVFLYAFVYTQGTPDKRHKLFSLLQLFAISMMVLVLADDMILLFLGWELTSISSYLLIQFNSSDESANQAAFNSLFVSVIGSLALLLGFVMLNTLSASWSIAQVNLDHAWLLHNTSLPIILCLFLGAVITKSAQFPFYFWLVGAMKAPTPVSAYLHSATMVNAGIYLLARFHPLFSQMDLWYPLLSFFGLMTMALSAVKSLFQTDLKAVLAYTTVFMLGAMVYLLGGRYAITVEAFALLLLFHGIYKAGAFMLVGTIDKVYGTRQLNQLHGIAKEHRTLAFSSIIILGAMAGLPPFYGFTVKEMIFEAKLAHETLSFLFMGVSILSSMIIAATSLRCLWYLFSAPHATAKPQKPLAYGFACPLLLAILILLFSLYDEAIRRIIEPVIQAVLPVEKPRYTDPFTGTSYLLSLSTAIGGILILFGYVRFRGKNIYWPKSLRLRNLFEGWVQAMLYIGKWLTQYTQGQSLSIQLRILFIAVFGLIGVSLPMGQTVWRAYHVYTLSFNNWFACLLLSLSAVSLIWTRKLLYNLISLSLVGFASSYYFLVNGAVDVAITQLLVEVLIIIILLIALRQLKTKPYTITKSSAFINTLIAGFSGLCISGILLSLRNLPLQHGLPNYYAENSWKAAFGNNVVNVILVDFRSLDTFGEAMVIVTVAIAVTVLLNNSMKRLRRGYVDNP